MIWVKANQLLPMHGQEVLIRHHRGIIDLAVYNRELSKFILKNGDQLSWVSEEMLWTIIGEPNNVQTT